ncbi:MAG: HAD-IIA family hydrolase [Actinobacteria bacterium]|nr:HAD-IIA family hydrolase [Actinomycetota bacterium]
MSLPPMDQYEALVCDLDGVVYRGDRAIDGAAEALGRLRDSGVKLLFCTNNSRSTLEQYVAKLTGLGIEVEPAEILTSAAVLEEILIERALGGKTALAVGGEGVRSALVGAGMVVNDDPESSVADLVAVGWDPGFDYAAMRRAALAVRASASLIATNDDAAFPAAEGELWPGAGAILASIEVAAGAKGEVLGKPHRPMMDAAARRLAPAARIAVVGDRAETDLAGGVAMGWPTILVLSGVTTGAEARRLDPKPDYVLDDLSSVARALTGVR